ncbi:DNA repair protein RecN [Aegicerativicinus sediminis]|uniref:DNA repair protein RecN n=1 Tax=Aegicerativicinus sediminis TaxID=2893202 RepID=UPI001E4AD0DE|nr:DNA repair protein RecN [Aegicerativicinus sediminis]
MLKSLTIKNYALIDDLSVNFQPGFNIITGETGAGKSILLEGLSLVLGKRADLSAIKDDSKKCIIEATFNIESYQLKPIFKEEDLDYEPNTIFRREILPSGKSRSFVNDTPVNLSSMQLLGEQLLDIHSQHQTLELTDDDFQFRLIDALADNSNLLVDYSRRLVDFKKLNKEIEGLRRTKSDLIKEYDYNTFLLNELLEAKLNNGELEELENELDVLQNAESILEHLSTTSKILSEEEMGILNLLRNAKFEINKIAGYNNNFQAILERIQSIYLELEDVSSEVAELMDTLETDPNRLQLVNDRISLINTLMHKHQVTEVSELIGIQNSLDSKILESDSIDESLKLKEFQKEVLQKELEKLSRTISENRSSVLPDLISKLKNILSSLGMPNSDFKVVLRQTDQFFHNGSDTLEFLFTANKGGNYLELKKAASGGELSRIMLAMKAIISQYIKLPTIIFDEIDTGVSGEISDKMGVTMKEMSKFMQVFSITHLPQIAAKGDHHFKVFKTEVDNVTSTFLKKLSAEERITEIASMLGGPKSSNSAIAHAKELLN